MLVELQKTQNQKTRKLIPVTFYFKNQTPLTSPNVEYIRVHYMYITILTVFYALENSQAFELIQTNLYTNI